MLTAFWSRERTARASSRRRIDLILVPGTAFDVRGHRIGQGGGYYDRYLNRTRAVRVGVCHDFALLSAVPSEAHDVRMDIVVTPGRTVIIREETT